YRSAEFQRRVDELAPRHDAVLAHLIRTGQYLATRKDGVPRVLLMADAISMTYQRMARLPRSFSLWPILYHTEIRRLEACERQLPMGFDQTWLHSDIDCRFLGLEQSRVRIVPMGVDLEDFPFRPGTDGDVVAFIGNMSSSMNLDACRHFICDVLPRLRSKAGIRFRVIGSCPPSVKKELEKYPGVEVTGRVSRIVDATGDVFCGVCPLRGGAGIQNKILNYLALGLPCVTSEIGLEGLRAQDGRDLLVYQSVDEAVKMILALHRDMRLRIDLARSGRQFVEREHDWASVYRRIQDEVSALWIEGETANAGRFRRGAARVS
ncbi:MAG: glycosyltransferase, partial [Terracidiphilus sp.]